MERSQIALVIPARNEAATIGPVVENLRRFGHVIVVDDGLDRSYWRKCA